LYWLEKIKEGCAMKYGIELKPKGYILEQESYVLVEYDAYTITAEKPKRIYKNRGALRQEIYDILNLATSPISSEKILDRISKENAERRALLKNLRKMTDERLIRAESVDGLRKYSLNRAEFNHG